VIATLDTTIEETIAVAVLPIPVTPAIAGLFVGVAIPITGTEVYPDPGFVRVIKVTLEFCAAVAGIALLNETGAFILTAVVVLDVLNNPFKILSIVIPCSAVTLMSAIASFPVPEVVVNVTFG
jgi:hypothetical protein